MAAVTIQVDQVSQTSGGAFQVQFSILVGGTIWQPNLQTTGMTEDEIKANTKAIATTLVSIEKERQKIKLGDVYTTGLNLNLVT